jgi:cytochrome b561
MNGTDHTEITAADGGDGFDPREAAQLVEQTNRAARREFESQTPLIALIGAAVFLFGYGAVWFSMRDQHPYNTGPALWSIGVLYGLVIVVAIVGGRVFRRASRGISGRARRQMQMQGLALAAAYVGAYVFMGALRYLGVSFAIIYGVYAPTVPLIVIGAGAAALAASQENWPRLGVAVAVVAVCAGSAYAGPVDTWLFAGLGCSLALVGYAVSLAILQRRI